MMQSLSPSQKERLTDILDRYLSALEAGMPADREVYCREHPDLAEVLEAYFQSIDELHGVAAGFAASPVGNDVWCPHPFPTLLK